MTDRELIQQALEALNHVNVQDRVQIITALRERLAQQHIEHCIWSRCGNRPCPHVQPKPWVGLTDEEIAEIEDGYSVNHRIPAGCAWNFSKDIEAKLREKNT